MTDFGWHYPPGAANDPNAPYNQPDHSHEHRWPSDEPGGDILPEIEDGAAIFYEECDYVEGRHREGWECEEYRKYRFEYSWLETEDDQEIELHPIEDWEKNDEAVREVIRCIKEAFHAGDTKWNVDPDPDCGVVSIEWEGWTLKYEPQ
jgi:hypothetical protein